MLLKYCCEFFTRFKENRKYFIQYSVFSLLVGLLELFGVALTYPFVIHLLSEKNTGAALLIGVIIILLFVVKNLFMIFYTYLQSRFTKSVETEVIQKLTRYFLNAPYRVTSRISYSKKLNILGFIVPNVINNFVLRTLNLIVNMFIFVFISSLLVVKFPLATLLTTVIAGILILVQDKLFKPKLQKIAKNFNESSILFNQSTKDALLNLKGVKIANSEKFFFENYKKNMHNFYENATKMLFLNSMPPYIIEPIIITLLFVLLAIISYQNIAEPEKLIASFAIIVSAICRLTPTISRIQVNLNGINSVIPFVQELFQLYDDFGLENVKEINDADYYRLKDSIELKNVSFGYEVDKTVLNNINIKINKGDFIGIAGPSGAGKTTLIDIVSGLIAPTSGELIIDGMQIIKPLKIGYISQEFFIVNGSIRENVAFGKSEIDDSLVIDVLKQACLYDFITQNYEDGIYANPFVDSQGFSQGQKQRLSIARALYANPDILILDEATSSLDLVTEQEICSLLLSLRGEKTIIAVAHRLSTIKSADKIAFIKDSQIKNFGKFDELIKINSDFQELVRIASLKST